jgi:hypothetical protein
VLFRFSTRPSAALRCIPLLTAALLAGCLCSKKVPAPAAPADDAITASLLSVWGSGPADVWAVGSDGAVVHYDGKHWVLRESGVKTRLSSVSGTAPDDVWAVGDEGVTLHFDGHTWSPVNSGDKQATLLSVRATSRSEVFISGIDGESGGVRYLHDGKAWEEHRVTASNSLWRTLVAGPKDIWMVGTDTKSKAFILRGQNDTFDRLPFEGGSLRGIYGANGDDVWVAEYSGGLHHWDGKAWANPVNVTDAHWLGMWGTDSKNVWAFGTGGMLYRYDGSAWSRVQTGTEALLWSAWGSAPNDVWIVGNEGTRLHWNGTALSRL